MLNAKLVQADKSIFIMSASRQAATDSGDFSNTSAGAHIKASREQKAGKGLTLRLKGERIFANRYRAINIRIVEGEMVTSLERSNPHSWRILSNFG
jgi:hypothetical protein